jgi:TPR repeat protein
MANSSAKPFDGKLRGRALAGAAVVVLIAIVAAIAILVPTSDARTALRQGEYGAAISALKPAAEAGDAWAQNALGNLYYLGLGTDTDYRQAIKLYWAAASQDNVDAMVNLGNIYVQGLGVPLDPMRGFAWYERAARSKDEKAMILLRTMAGAQGLPLLLTPNQIQRSRELYRTLDDLKP